MKTLVQIPLCPICERGECNHFIGWTEDGETVEAFDSKAGRWTKEPLKHGDKIAKTGVAARVYRPFVADFVAGFDADRIAPHDWCADPSCPKCNKQHVMKCGA